ncbi:hypothetical protein CerSpe_070070 [Prunus speciosa]
MRGRLKEYATGDATPTNAHARSNADDKPGTSQVYISTISGGPTIAGNSNRAIKSCARPYRQATIEVMAMEATENPPTRPTAETEPITFFQADTASVNFPHHDPLVIMAKITHCEVAQVFLDGGSSVNIIFFSAFRQLGVSDKLLDRRCPTLVAFGEGTCSPSATCT